MDVLFSTLSVYFAVCVSTVGEHASLRDDHTHKVLPLDVFFSSRTEGMIPKFITEGGIKSQGLRNVVGMAGVIWQDLWDLLSTVTTHQR